ncbi:MAG: auxin-responsive promoter family protein [Capsulimonas sp.]|jgi:hypothetical protein|nr:auxin-responsive promoter family protein [Capsulimonas sp.]
MSLEPFTTIAACRYRKRLDRVEETQRALLRQILADCRHSPLAQELGLTGFESFEEFLKLSPRSYDFYSPFCRRVLNGDSLAFGANPIVAFGETSGSTGEPKLIPHTHASLDLVSRFMRMLLLFHTADGPAYFPRFSVWLLVAATSFTRREAGVDIGFISGLMYKQASGSRRKSTAPSPDVALIQDWDERIKATATQALTRRVGAIFGVPAYVGRLLAQASEQAGGRPLFERWPLLTKIYYSGTPFEPYRAEIEGFIGRSVTSKSMYMATEGIFAAELDPGMDGAMRLLPHNMLMAFRDVEKANSALLPMWELEEGCRYELIISTIAGLLQYRIGDIIEVVRRRPLMVRVAGRVGDEINLATEKLSLAQAQSVMAQIARKCPVSHSRFLICPDPRGHRRHLWLIERGAGDPIVEIDLQIDRALAEINPSYAALRAADAVLNMPRVLLLEPGAFDAYISLGLKSRGQFKFRHLHSDCSRIASIAGLERIHARISQEAER